MQGGYQLLVGREIGAERFEFEPPLSSVSPQQLTNSSQEKGADNLMREAYLGVFHRLGMKSVCETVDVW